MKASGVIGKGSDGFPIVWRIEAKKRGIRCAVYIKLLKLTPSQLYLAAHQSQEPLATGHWLLGLFSSNIRTKLPTWKFFVKPNHFCLGWSNDKYCISHCCQNFLRVIKFSSTNSGSVSLQKLVWRNIAGQRASENAVRCQGRPIIRGWRKSGNRSII